MTIRKADKNDVIRMAEIIVFNNRLNYYPIFQDILYSFKEYNVESVSKMFLEDTVFMDNTYVYEEQVIKGFICVTDGEIRKCYVDYFFQGEGIGNAMMDYAVSLGANHLWVLQKNSRAIAFYQKHGFELDDQKKLEDDTTEYVLHMVRK